MPFFVSFVIRTTAWYTLLADQGTILNTLKNLHLVPESFHLLATPLAVIGGLAYNYLPFTALPLYVALERIDRRVMEASHDLYATRRVAFTAPSPPSRDCRASSLLLGSMSRRSGRACEDCR